MNTRKADKGLLSGVTSCYIGLMMTVFLFYTGKFGFQGIADAKYSVFLAICGGYILIMLLLMVELVLIGRRRFPSIRSVILKSSWTQRLMVVYLFLTWVSAVISPYFPTTIVGATRDEGVLTITIYILVYLLVSIYGKIQKWMLPAFAVSVSAFDMLCVLQLYGLNPFTLYPEGYNYFGANLDYGGAYLGTIGNVDSVAAFLCIVIPILWSSLVRLRDKCKWFLLIPLGLSLFVLLKMWVLAGLVGVFAGSAISLCVILPVSKRAKKYLCGILLCCAIIALALIFYVDVGNGLLHELHMLFSGRGEDSFGSGRIHIWKEVLSRVPEQLWFGSGPDTMHLANLDPFRRYDERLGMLIVAEIDLAHNEYLNILFHQGIFAVLAYLVALLSAARDWLRRESHNCTAAVSGSAVLCYCIQAFFGFSLCVVSPYFWIILAFLEKTKRE